MNPGLKQRLVGAVVLVALAVIFLPMLLDGSGARERLDEDIQIPEKPEPPESQLVTDGGGSASSYSADSAPAGSNDTSSAAQEAAGTGSTDSGAANAEDSQAAAVDSTAGTQQSTDATQLQSGDSGTGAEEGPDEGWVVQVGSFRRETNALVLRDKLRQDGFDAHADRVQTDGRTLWRVRLGPVAEREAGEALLERIEAHRGSDALLMSYP